ncbi:hypothetical protein Tco_0868754 [Tanacetum coccineum]
MTDAQINQDTKDVHVTLIAEPLVVQQQSSSISSDLVSMYINPSSDTGIDSILNQNVQSHNLVNVPVFVAPVTPSAASTIPQPPVPIIQTLQQTLDFITTTTIPTTTLPDIPNFASLKYVVDVAIQLQSNKLKEEAQAENEEFIKQTDSNMKAIIKEQVKAQVSKIMPKTSYAVTTSLSEFELKKILIDKMEENKSINRSDIQKNLYNALVESYNSHKDIISSYGDVVKLKRGRDDQDNDEDPSAGSNRGSKRRRSGKEDESSKEPTHKESKSTSSSKGYDDVIPIRETLDDASQWNTQSSPTPDSTGIQSSFNEFLATPIDLSAFIMNRLKIENLTQDVLTGLTYDLMKGTCKSVVELEYHLKEVFKATNDQLDWHNPEGRPYPHDLNKPLPLILNARGCQVIPLDHFINNDLEYLKGGSLSQRYTTSITKTKAADYGHVKWIEDKGPKRQKFYGYAANMETSKDVYSKHRIIADDQLYKFREGDFKRLRQQDIEDMLLLLVQGKLTNLNLDERYALNVALRMYTRCIIIQERVEDLQLGVESYQKKINLSRPDSYRSDLRKMTPYTAYPDIQVIIYQDDMDKNHLMRTEELHKFSDGTLNHVHTALNDIATGIQMKYLPKRKWSKQDKQRARVMINAIDKKLIDKRLMRSLKKFVGGRPYEGDLRLFDTSAGNPVKEILLKLNLPDHRSILTDSKMEVKPVEAFKTDLEESSPEATDERCKPQYVDLAKSLSSPLPPAAIIEPTKDDNTEMEQCHYEMNVAAAVNKLAKPCMESSSRVSLKEGKKGQKKIGSRLFGFSSLLEKKLRAIDLHRMIDMRLSEPVVRDMPLSEPIVWEFTSLMTQDGVLRKFKSRVQSCQIFVSDANGISNLIAKSFRGPELAEGLKVFSSMGQKEDILENELARHYTKNWFARDKFSADSGKEYLELTYFARMKDGRISYEEFQTMMKAGTEWR